MTHWMHWLITTHGHLGIQSTDTHCIQQQVLPSMNVHYRGHTTFNMYPLSRQCHVQCVTSDVCALVTIIKVISHPVYAWVSFIKVMSHPTCAWVSIIKAMSHPMCAWRSFIKAMSHPICVPKCPLSGPCHIQFVHECPLSGPCHIQWGKTRTKNPDASQVGSFLPYNSNIDLKL